jgi:hypothetical protein
MYLLAAISILIQFEKEEYERRMEEEKSDCNAFKNIKS